MNKMLIIILMLVFIITVFPSTNSFAADDDNYGIYTKAQIQATKDRLAANDPETVAAFNQFMSRVDDWCMVRTCHAPKRYYVPGYYIKPEEHISASKILTHDAYAAYGAGLAWLLTGEDKYAEKARELISGWAKNNTDIDWWDDTPLVSAYSGVGFVYAAEFLTDYPGWTKADETAFKSWLTDRYRPSVNNIFIGWNDKTNNWASWGILSLMVTDNYLGNTSSVDTLANATLPSSINFQIGSTGKFQAEIDRGVQGMWYTYFSLAPLTQAAQVAYNITGVNHFDKGTYAVKLKKALDFYLPYVKNPDLWDAEFKASKYPDGDLVRPTMSNGNVAQANWPANLYCAMADIYGSEGAAYAELVEEYGPIMGGWNDREAHHIGWSFPSLIRGTTLITEPLPTPESITDNFEADKLSPHWEVQRFALNGSVSGINAELCEDPANTNNQVVKLSDTMKGAWATTGSTGCVELVADMLPVAGTAELSFNIKFSGTKSYMSGAHILDTAHGDAVIASLMYAENGKLILRRPTTAGGATSDLEVTGAMQNDRWYNIRFIVNTASKTVDLYIDNELKAANQHFRINSAVNMTRIKFTTDSSADATTNYIDNVYAGPAKGPSILTASLTNNTSISATVINGADNVNIFAAAYGTDNRLLAVSKLTPASTTAGTVTKATGAFASRLSGIKLFRVFIFDSSNLASKCNPYIKNYQ